MQLPLEKRQIEEQVITNMTTRGCSLGNASGSTIVRSIGNKKAKKIVVKDAKAQHLDFDFGTTIMVMASANVAKTKAVLKRHICNY